MESPLGLLHEYAYIPINSWRGSRGICLLPLGAVGSLGAFALQWLPCQSGELRELLPSRVAKSWIVTMLPKFET
jgi:hypothetical protein